MGYLLGARGHPNYSAGRGSSIVREAGLGAGERASGLLEDSGSGLYRSSPHLALYSAVLALCAYCCLGRSFDAERAEIGSAMPRGVIGEVALESR